MHICKSPRRKIARKCIFCAGVPAYACIRAGATAQKSNRAAIFSSGRNLAKMPGIALQYLRREPARREGACRSYEKILTYPNKCVFFYKKKHNFFILPSNPCICGLFMSQHHTNVYAFRTCDFTAASAFHASAPCAQTQETSHKLSSRLYLRSVPCRRRLQTVRSSVP